jgi:PKD repeat protein
MKSTFATGFFNRSYSQTIFSMKSLLRSLLFIFIFKLSSYGQNHFCGQSDVMEHFFSLHPEWRTEFEKNVKENSNRKPPEKQDKTNTSEPEFIIPVVFHVIHQGGPENISDAQIEDQVRILNRDFNKQNADTSLVVNAFQDLVANVGFGFKLARIDPEGKCTNGITRHFTSRTNWDANDLSYFAYSWPRNKYLNVYVVKNNSLGVNAYTFLPGTPIPPAADAIVIVHNSTGSIGTASLANSRVLTHEVGHWFGLQHIWGTSNQPGVTCGDDLVEDTPITKGFTSCNTSNTGICNPGITENVQNYMDYAPCKIMFTLGQADRMLGFMTGTLNGRNNLFTEANLLATGISGPNYACNPSVDFKVNRLKSCTNRPFQFTSFVNTGPVSGTRTWSFPGGSPASSTDSIPSVSYALPGNYSVSLTITTPTEIFTETKEDFISVENPSNGKTLPYSFDFETDSLISDLQVVNFDPISSTWFQNTSLGAIGSGKCFMLNSYNDINEIQGEKDALELPYLDLSGMENISLSYYYAYARLSSAQRDSFKVQFSLDCGGTWTNFLGIPTPAQMGAATGGTSASEFIPGSNQWAQHIIPANRTAALNNKNGVKIRFLFVKDITQPLANNIFLDQIQINGLLTSAKALLEKVPFSIYPNPSNGSIFVKCKKEIIPKMEGHVFDMQGRYWSNVVKKQSQGELVINEKRSMPKGIYTLMLNLDGQLFPQKLVVN